MDDNPSSALTSLIDDSDLAVFARHDLTERDVIAWIDHCETSTNAVLTLYDAVHTYGSVNVLRIVRQARQVGVCAAPTFTVMLTDPRFTVELDSFTTDSLAPFIRDCATVNVNQLT